MEAKRRCGFIAPELRGPKKVVWGHGGTATDECPKSLISPESLEFVEKFLVWKFSGGGGFGEITAREADAFMMLEEEWRRESKNGEQPGY